MLGKATFQSLMTAVLEFERVSKYFYRHGGRMLLRDRLAHALHPSSRERFYALTDVSFTLEHGESMAIVGSNGAGKSTLLNIATSLCDPSDGRVTHRRAGGGPARTGIGVSSRPHRRRESCALKPVSWG